MARSATPNENSKPETVTPVSAYKAGEGKDPPAMVPAYARPGAPVGGYGRPCRHPVTDRGRAGAARRPRGGGWGGW